MEGDRKDAENRDNFNLKEQYHLPSALLLRLPLPSASFNI